METLEEYMQRLHCSHTTFDELAAQMHEERKARQEAEAAAESNFVACGIANGTIKQWKERCEAVEADNVILRARWKKLRRWCDDGRCLDGHLHELEQDEVKPDGRQGTDWIRHGGRSEAFEEMVAEMDRLVQL